MYQTGHFLIDFRFQTPIFTKTLSIYKMAPPAQYGESVSSDLDEIQRSNSKKVSRGGSNLINTNAFLKVPILKT